MRGFTRIKKKNTTYPNLESQERLCLFGSVVFPSPWSDPATAVSIFAPTEANLAPRIELTWNILTVSSLDYLVIGLLHLTHHQMFLHCTVGMSTAF